MKDTLRRRCERFIEARDRIRETFRWENSYLPPVCANLFCARDRMPEEERLQECREMISRNTGVFSTFRGNVRTPMACMLSMEADPEEKLRQAQELYAALKQYFSGSDYLALAALLLTDRDFSEERMARGKRIYRLMNEEHPILTSNEDSVFAVLMAWSDRSDEVMAEDVEACYRILKERFRDRNCAQTVAQILAMEEGSAADKCGMVFTLYDAVDRRGGKYGKHYELATLAALAMLEADPETLAEDMMEVDAFLAEQKGYGFWGIGKKMRLMHAAMIVSDEYVLRQTVDRAALAATLSVILAQQAASAAAASAAAST